MRQFLPAEHISLAGLSHRSVTMLLQRIFYPAQAEQTLVDRLVEVTSGNALLILELLRTANDKGQLRVTENKIEVTTLVSDSQQVKQEDSIILQRLKHLPLIYQQLLKAAAVWGQRFTFSQVQAVATISSSQIATGLGYLQRTAYLIEDETHFEFEHEALQQVAYNQIALTEVPQLHQLAVAWLQREVPEAVDVLAYHAQAAGLWSVAIKSCFQMALRAQKQSAYQSALQQLEQALHMLETYQPLPLAEATQLAFDIRLVYTQLHDVRSATQQMQWRDNIDQLQQLASKLGEMAKLQADLCLAHFLNYEYADHVEARLLAKKVLTQAQQLGAYQVEFKAYHLVGLTYITASDFKAAVPWLQEAFERKQEIETSASVDLMAFSVERMSHDLGLAYWGQGLLPEATIIAQRMLEEAKGNSRLLAYAHNLLVLIALSRQTVAECIFHCEQVVKATRMIGARLFEAIALCNQGGAYTMQPNFGAAIARMEAGLAIHQRFKSAPHITMATLSLGVTYANIGQLERGYLYCERALVEARELGMQMWIVLALCKLSQLCLQEAHEPDVVKATTLLQEATVVAVALEAPYEAAEVAFHWGLVRQAAGDVESACAAWQWGDYFAKQAEYVLHSMLCRSYLAVGKAIWGAYDEAQVLSQTVLDEFEAIEGGEWGPLFYYHHWRVLFASRQPSQRYLQIARQLMEEQMMTLPDDSWYESYLTAVSLHRHIQDAYSRYEAGQQTVQLAHMDAPLGRPLQANEYVAVTWTVTSPEDDYVDGKTSRRRRRLQRLMHQAYEQQGSPTVVELAHALKVSSKTIRRDLATLRKLNVPIHTRKNATNT